MYNKYFSDDRDAFSEFYKRVDVDEKLEGERSQLPYVGEKREKQGFDLKRLLNGIDIEKVGILPIVLLLLLLIDATDDEKLLIIALAVIFGI